MPNHTPYTLLPRINDPADLRQLDLESLSPLAEELRDFLIHSVAQTGGHLAAGLGTVELTIALHYVFNTPQDRLVWDVGHQSYPHKILTGRRERMPTLRQKNGLAGFPKREESPYDTFGVGHSSTSISAALGMAIAAQRKQEPHKTVAVIGDGALTAGMAFEALNHAGDLGADLLVVLNDNEMSISPNVGGMANYLAKMLTGKIYSTVRESGKKALKSMPAVWELARRAEEHVKGMVIPGTLFEELGFNYVGPIDGHDIPTLVQTLKNLKAMHGPRFLHVVTKKGKGYLPAEENPCFYHGVNRFDPATGQGAAQKSTGPTFTQVFGTWLCDMAVLDTRLVGITPAMREGSGLVEFSEQFPERYFDVGIAEQHSVTLAAGLACEGLKPVVAIYSTFLQRAYDQLIHDVCIQNLPVLFAIDRAGLVGPDGPTHTGAFDLSYLRCIPNMVIMAPADENECRQMLYTGFMHTGPAAVRYPRGSGAGVPVQKNMTALTLGKAQIVRTGQQIAILVFGTLLPAALEAGDKLNATVINMRFVKPLDEKQILNLALNHAILVTVEENALAGGAGSAVGEYMAQCGVHCPLLQLGLPDDFVEQSSRDELLKTLGLDANGIYKHIKNYIKNREIKTTQSG